MNSHVLLSMNVPCAVHGQEIFLSPIALRLALGPNQPPVRLVWERAKQSGNEVLSSVSSTEVMNVKLHSLCAFITWYLIKHRGNFTVY
jgi:hypothetical protein